ncbi:UPF0160-domain-containing protein [Backusella circina FSU 941]|nr:UPF0160-domain-containing protein [Backusella circina FSU 941]
MKSFHHKDLRKEDATLNAEIRQNVKMLAPIWIKTKQCTHSGSFHCNEALAAFMLKQTKEFQRANVIHTRDPLLLEKYDVIVDVGSVYDPSRQRYGHHQDFVESLDADENDISVCRGTPIYNENPTSLVIRVKRVNSCWNEYMTSSEIYARLTQASEIAGTELQKSWIPTHLAVLVAIKDRHKLDGPRRISLDIPCS